MTDEQKSRKGKQLLLSALCLLSGGCFLFAGAYAVGTVMLILMAINIAEIVWRPDA